MGRPRARGLRGDAGLSALARPRQGANVLAFAACVAAREEGRELYEGEESAALRRTSLAGAAMGMFLGALVSYGIVIQRVSGTTVASSVGANVVTTLAAVAAVIATVRVFLAAIGESSVASRRLRERAIRHLTLAQAAGGLLGVLAVHAMLARAAAAHPWLCEHPRQLVNDVVGVFGILAFVWSCAREPIRVELMIGGLALVLCYELTAAYWHLDGPVPLTDALPWSIQRFVGSEVTSSGLGVIAFRLTLA